jgi:hypothetical protein
VANVLKGQKDLFRKVVVLEFATEKVADSETVLSKKVADSETVLSSGRPSAKVAL